MNKTIGIFALLTAVVLVIGTLVVTPALASSGNPIINQRNTQIAAQSGFHNSISQSASNSITTGGTGYTHIFASSGNPIINQRNTQIAAQSGFHNSISQSASNSITTHPGG
jgi:hypothetical protein